MQVEAWHEREIEFSKTRRRNMKNVRCQHVESEIGMHAHWRVWQPVCPDSTLGNTASAGKKKKVMCTRMTPSVEVKSDTGFFSQDDFKGHLSNFTHKVKFTHYEDYHSASVKL